MTRPSEIDAAETQRMVLRETLRPAVPTWMRGLRNWHVEDLLAAAAADSQTVATHGDDLQYGGKHCKDTFHALARGLAITALQADGGVDFLGLHWCAIPHCRAATRFDHAEDTGGPGHETRPAPDPAGGAA